MDNLNPNWEEYFTGCLVGLAVGDALGSATEGKGRQEIAEQFSGPLTDYQPRESLTLVAGHDEYEMPGLPAGSTTEDTFLALLHARSLINTGGKVEPLDFGPYFVEALNSKIEPFMGFTTRVSLLRARETGDFQAGLAEEHSAGNGVAVRIAPVGLMHVYGQYNRESFLADCERAARLTHNNPVAIAGGVAVATAVRLLCRHEIIPEDLMAAALDMLQPGYLGLPMAGNPMRQKLIVAQDYIEERQTLVDNVEANDLDVDFFRIDLNNLERCGTSGYAPETVAAAFYAFAARKDSFEEAVTLAINAGGDSDAIASITGALSGAYLGLSAIPERWRNGLLNYQEVLQVAKDLHKTVRSRELTDYAGLGI
ncbi:MAG TPA: ADP-ribosylglycohydrolase family protein [Chloroflexia bacterium]|nr:ADP-ribosylglycohydrolase family protein [Chloroflexia bacterium]